MTKTHDLVKKLTKEIGLIRNDLKEVKARLKNLTQLDVETYEVKPEYIKKLKNLERGSGFTTYKTARELRKEIENV